MGLMVSSALASRAPYLGSQDQPGTGRPCSLSDPLDRQEQALWSLWLTASAVHDSSAHWRSQASCQNYVAGNGAVAGQYGMLSHPHAGIMHH